MNLCLFVSEVQWFCSVVFPTASSVSPKLFSNRFPSHWNFPGKLVRLSFAYQRLIHPVNSKSFQDVSQCICTVEWTELGNAKLPLSLFEQWEARTAGSLQCFSCCCDTTHSDVCNTQ